jgi:tetratricopeptide (TPR) repeat protein
LALQAAAALNIDELALRRATSWWWEHANAGTLLATLRTLSRRMTMGPDFAFLLDLCFADLQLRLGLFGFEIPDLVDRIDSLDDYYRHGVNGKLGSLAAEAGRRLLGDGSKASLVSSVAPAELFKAAVRLAPRDPRVHEHAVQAFIQARNYPSAVESLLAILTLEPQEPTSVFFVDDVLWELGRPSECLRALESLAAYQPEDAHVRRRLAFRWLCQGDFRQACTHYLEAARVGLETGDMSSVRGSWMLARLAGVTPPGWLPGLDTLDASTESWQEIYELVASIAGGQSRSDELSSFYARAEEIKGDDPLAAAKFSMYAAFAAHGAGQDHRAVELLEQSGALVQQAAVNQQLPAGTPDMVHILTRLCELQAHQNQCEDFAQSVRSAAERTPLLPVADPTHSDDAPRAHE